MCLADITLGPDSTAKAVGYKVFQKVVDGYRSILYGRARLYQKDIWYEDIRQNMVEDFDFTPYYKCGYHIFYSEAAAKVYLNELHKFNLHYQFVLTKVSVENRTAEGEDCWKSEKAGVYRRMRIDADILTL